MKTPDRSIDSRAKSSTRLPGSPLRLIPFVLLSLLVSTCTDETSPTAPGATDIPVAAAVAGSPIEWDGDGGDGLWSNPLNWVGDILPGAGDPVTIDNAGTVHVDVDATVGAFRFGVIAGSTSALVIDAGVTLTLHDDPTDRSTTIILNEGVTNNGTILVEDGVSFGTGTYTNNGLIRIAGPGGGTLGLEGGVLTMSGGNVHASDPSFGNTFINNGTIESEGSLSSVAAGKLINNGTIHLTNGRLEWAGQSRDFYGVAVTSKFDFHNAASGVIDGTAYVIIGRATGPYGEEYEVPFRNDGTVDLAPGTVIAWTILNRTTIQNAGSIGSSSGLIRLDCAGDIYPRSTLTTPVDQTCHSWTGNGSTDNWSEALNWSNQAIPPSGTTLPINIGAGVPTPTLDVDFTANGFFELTAAATLTVGTGRSLTLNGRVDLDWGSGGRAASLINLGTIHAAVQVTNYGVIDNRGTLTTADAVENDGTILNSGTWSNDGALENLERVENSGSMTNNGSINNPAPHNGTNYIPSQFVTTNEFVNNGAFVNHGGILTNEGTLTNAVTGTIENRTLVPSYKSTVYNGTSASIDNAGYMEFQAQTTLNNDGTITNDGSIVALCYSRLEGAGTVQNTPIFLDCGIWDGEAGDGLWSSPLNWVGDMVPGAGVPVVIENSGTVHVDLDVSVGSFRFGIFAGSTSALIIDPGVTLTLHDDPTDRASTIILNEGMTNDGTILVEDGVTFGTGTYTNNGLIRIAGPGGGTLGLEGGVLGMSGGPYHASSPDFGNSFINNGTIESEGSLSSVGAGQLINNGAIHLANARLEWAGESRDYYGTDVSSKFDFHNAATGVIDGTAYVILGRNPTSNGVEYDVPFRNDGTIDLAPGTVNTWTILNRATIENGGTIGSSGELQNEGAAINACGAAITMPVTGNPVQQLACNATPEVEAGSDQTVDEGASVSLSGASFTDPDASPFSATVDWGDGSSTDLGSVTPGPLSASHTYDDNGSYEVAVCVADSEPLNGCDTFMATVNNVAPAVTGQAVSAREGIDFVELVATFTDPGLGDTYTATVDWDDGYGAEAATIDGDGADGYVLGGHTYEQDGSYDVEVCVTDDDGGSNCDTGTVTVANLEPIVDAGNPILAVEGRAVSLSAASFTDDGVHDVHTATVDWGDGNGPQSATISESNGSGTVSAGHTYGDNGLFSVEVCVADDGGEEACTTTSADVTNALPGVTMSGPLPYAVYGVGQSIPLEGSFTDAGFLDSHSGTWTLQAGAGTPVSVVGVVTESGGVGSVTASAQLTEPGLYQITLSVTDDDGGTSATTAVNGVEAMIVVFDPSGGFVTGGGWFDSPAGACQAWPGCQANATGMAHFGFVSRYRNGANTPDGTTGFRFSAGDLDFRSTAYEWLVVNQNGASAQFKGSGTINGQRQYQFMIWAIDDDAGDTFRIKIWEEVGGVEIVMYDNGSQQLIGGGNVLVQTGRGR